MLFTNTIAVVVTSLLSVAKAAPTDPNTDFPSELIHSMDSHDHGFHGLGKDGVLRTFAPNHTVIDAVKLSSAQIQQLIHVHVGGHNDHLVSMFDGVDGHDVTNVTQLLHPDDEHVASLFKDNKDDGKSAPQSPNPAYSGNGKAERHLPPVDPGKIPLLLPPPKNPSRCQVYRCQESYDCQVLPAAPQCNVCIHYPGDYVQYWGRCA